MTLSGVGPSTLRCGQLGADTGSCNKSRLLKQIQTLEIDVLATILVDAGDDDYYGHMDGWGGGWMWLWGVAMMVLFSVLIVWLVRSNYAPNGQALRPPESTDGARAILAERFAKGELSTDEYQERVEVLR